MRFGAFPSLLLLILAITGVGSAKAVDFRTKFDIQANGVYRSLSQQGFSDAVTVGDGLLFLGSQVIATSDWFELEVRQEFRSVFGDTPSYPPGDIARLNIQSPERFMQLDRMLVENKGINIISDIERLRASLVFPEGEAWVGRRPVSLGVISFFKVWNKFTRPVSGLFGPTIVYGSDGFGGSYQSGDFSFKAMSLFGPDVQDDAHLLEVAWFNPFAEFRFLGGRWWDRNAVGFAFSKTVFDWMLRLETLYLSKGTATAMAANPSETQIGLGFDGAINSALSLLVENYFQSIGAMDTTDYSITDPSRFTNLRAKFYTFAILNWQMSTLWKSGFGDLFNGVDGGQLFSLRLNYSLSDNIELLSEFNLPLASDGAEFAKRTFVFKDGSYLGSGSQFSLGLKASF